VATANDGDTDFPRAAGAPARGALIAEGYTRLEQLTGMTERELLKLHGVGPKAVGVLKEALSEQGLSFKVED
jgi:DNA-directed RNA polymerase alpha subunit